MDSSGLQSVEPASSSVQKTRSSKNKNSSGHKCSEADAVECQCAVRGIQRKLLVPSRLHPGLVEFNGFESIELDDNNILMYLQASDTTGQFSFITFIQ